MTNTETIEIVNAIRSLPSEKFSEVRDYVLFLKERYDRSQIVDYSDEWSEEDMNDIALASFEYFEEQERSEAEQ